MYTVVTGEWEHLSRTIEQVSSVVWRDTGKSPSEFNPEEYSSIVAVALGPTGKLFFGIDPAPLGDPVNHLEFVRECARRCPKEQSGDKSPPKEQSVESSVEAALEESIRKITPEQRAHIKELIESLEDDERRAKLEPWKMGVINRVADVQEAIGDLSEFIAGGPEELSEWLNTRIPYEDRRKLYTDWDYFAEALD